MSGRGPPPLVRARAPLRLGFAGGGTDVAPYCDVHGGAVVNSSIGLYAQVTISPAENHQVIFIADDVQERFEAPMQAHLPLTHPALLHRGVYNRMVRDFNGGQPLSVRVHSSVEVPMGSGLGSSSALVVALIEAFRRYLQIDMTAAEIAALGFDIERKDLALAGGQQDHYAAAFGGFNFMEFLPGGRTLVHPLRVELDVRRELESSILLCFFGQARQSARIIAEQQANMANAAALEAFHALKADALDVRTAFLRGDLAGLVDIINRGWAAKRRTAAAVSTSAIDQLIGQARAHGALAAKLSGAGGGGFLLLIVDPARREALLRFCEDQGARVLTCRFVADGVHSWHPAAAAG